MGSSRVLVPARYVSIALVVSAPAGCLPRRATGEYSTPIAMTVAEADRVDALDEEARKLGDDPRARCDFWAASSRAVPKTELGATKYVEERRSRACDDDPGFEFRGTLDLREATIRKATEGYFARGSNFEVRSGTPVTIRLARGECYRVALRFPEGFSPRSNVRTVHERFLSTLGKKVELDGGEQGPGPVVMMGLSCAFDDQDGTITMTADPGTVAQATLFVRTISEEEVKRREAEDRRGWEQAEADSKAYAAVRAREHCVRCAEDLRACGTQPDCQRAYVECLSEDRGDEVLTPEQCR